MRVLRWCRWPALLALPLLLGSATLPACGQAPDAKVTLQVAKLDDLTKTLAGLKGQVVVLDFWANY